LWWPSLTGLTADDDKVGSCTTTVADYTRMVDDILRWEMGTALKREAYVQQFSCGFCNSSAVSPTCLVDVHDVRVSLAEVNASCFVVHGCLLVALYAQSFVCLSDCVCHCCCCCCCCRGCTFLHASSCTLSVFAFLVVDFSRGVVSLSTFRLSISILQ